MTDVLALAAHLAARGEPFVLATVVWRRAPSSGKEGSRAVITADGRLRGWLGGACAEPAVLREARRVLEEGTARLMFLGPPEELAGRRREGVVAVPIACQSEGAMEVYLEAVMPKPRVVAIGRSPMVDALARMAEALGWVGVVVDDGGSPEDHPVVERVVTGLDLRAAGASEGSAVVVATQGHYDESALEAALATPAPYVGLVASRRRAEAVLGYLRDRGFPEEELRRVRAPAGLDLGAVSHEEIAVAVLAELVSLRAAGALRAAPPEEAPRHEATDPVCGMAVDVASARDTAVHEGRTFYFCGPRCVAAFRSDPLRYANAQT